MNLKKLLMISTTLVLGASPAFADDEAAASADATATTPAGGAAAGMDANATAGGAATMGWSKSVIDRPLVLGKGQLAAYGDFDIFRLSFTDPVSMTSATATAEGLSLGAGYGVTDKITAGVNYAFSIHDFEIKGPLTLFGSLDIMHNDKLSVAANADILINLGDTTTETLQAGLGVRYKVTPKVAVFTGGGSFPGALLAFGSAYGPLAGSPVGQHLAIGLNSNAPISFDIPVGVGLQATPELYVGVSTALAHIGISNDDNAFFGADYIPVNVGALFAVNEKIDAGAFLNLPDMKEIQFDLMFIGITARYHQ